MNYSTPNVKLRIKDTRYVYSGGTVHCFLTMEDMYMNDDPYIKLARTCEQVLGMEFAINTQFKATDYSRFDYMGRKSNCDKYIYVPSDYEYHGFATLKEGDVNDVSFAKKVAYKKAYRQLVRFYYNCYYNLYNKIGYYTSDVWFQQMEQLFNKVIAAESAFDSL